MTLQDDNFTITYTGDGQRTTFELPFRLFDPDNLKVTVDSTPYFPNTHYTVTITNELDSQSATVTFLEAPEGLISLTREMPIRQAFDFSQVSSVDGATLEEALDQVVAMIMQIKLQSGKSLTLPLGGSLDGELPVPVAGGFLSVSSNGETWEFSIPSERLIAVSETSPDSDHYVLWYDQVNRQLKYWTGDSWTNAASADSGKIDRVTGGDLEDRVPVLTPGGGLVSSGFTIPDLQDDPLEHDRLSDIANMTPEQGTVVVGDGSKLTGLQLGAEGSVLTVDRSSASGLRYVPPASGVIQEVGKVIITDDESSTAVVTFKWPPGEYRKIELIGHELKPASDRSVIKIQLGYESNLESIYWTSYAWTFVNSAEVLIRRVPSSDAIVVPPETDSLGIDSNLQHSAIWFSLTVGNLGYAMSPIFNLISGNNIVEGSPISYNATGECKIVNLNRLSTIRIFWRDDKSFKTGSELSLIGYK
ncbi:MAG: hypothetical protein N0E48_16045 [Candidatus Thiodiazotropha endolucinida]|nr:hypothetical protein [Candidatus Thiodiazotropha taylori]MCW4344843.1 hypothetical protein [Candidatus Thiodiazotropha endolucinida]